MNFKFPWTKRKEEQLRREAHIRWRSIVFDLTMMQYDEPMIPLIKSDFMTEYSPPFTYQSTEITPKMYMLTQDDFN